jgi:hypothetical protein
VLTEIVGETDGTGVGGNVEPFKVGLGVGEREGMEVGFEVGKTVGA